MSASTTTASGLPVSPDTAVGFVGLGRMGGAMASRVLGAGLTVYGTSRSRDRANDLVESGLRWCGTSREVAEQTRAIFSSIPDDRRWRRSPRARTVSLPASPTAACGSR